MNLLISFLIFFNSSSVEDFVHFGWVLVNGSRRMRSQIMDVHIPPPSYEAATGIPAGQNPLFDSYPAASPPVLPPYDDELNTVSVMAPILKPPCIQPYNPNSFPGTIISPQSEALSRQDQYKTDNKICVCFFIILIALVLLMAIFVVVGRKSTTKYTDNELRTHTINTVESQNHRHLNWRVWRKTNNELYNQMEEQRKEPVWEYSNERR